MLAGAAGSVAGVEIAGAGWCGATTGCACRRGCVFGWNCFWGIWSAGIANTAVGSGGITFVGVSAMVAGTGALALGDASAEGTVPR
jgi:hypothetical protein